MPHAGCLHRLLLSRCHFLQDSVLAVAAIGSPNQISKQKADGNLEVKTLEPEYPAEARARGIEGVVRLRVLINQLGNVTDVKVISGNALLLPPAVAVVKRFPYRPFIGRGHPAPVRAEVDIPFVLHPVTPREIYDRWTSCRDAARSLRKDGHVDAAVERLQEALGYAEKIGPIEVADTYGDLAELYTTGP